MKRNVYFYLIEVQFNSLTTNQKLDLKNITCFYIVEAFENTDIIDANSIDISPYRSRIGTFAGTKSASKTGEKVSLENKLKTNTALQSFIILSYLLVLSNVKQKLLIMSGMELNTGPSFPLGKICCFLEFYFLWHFFIKKINSYPLLFSVPLFS